MWFISSCGLYYAMLQVLQHGMNPGETMFSVIIKMAFWWVFCSHILCKLSNVELTSCLLYWSGIWFEPMSLICQHRHLWSQSWRSVTGLSKVVGKSFYLLLLVYTKLKDVKCHSKFQKWNVSTIMLCLSSDYSCPLVMSSWCSYWTSPWNQGILL